MQSPPILDDESRRLEALRRLAVLDTPPEERFDRFTRLACRTFGVPIALVSLVDFDRQWFKSRQGLDATETPREISFCGHAILSPQTLVVPDALDDERFATNPLVTEDPSIRFYAGRPIAAPSGEWIGTLCLIDRKPRELSEEDLVLLDDLAQMVENELAAEHRANVDYVTGLSNRHAFEVLAQKALGMCHRLERPASLLFLDLDHFKAINDAHGHAAGDRALREFGTILLDAFRDCDVAARFGGDEFCVLLSGTAADRIESPLKRLASAVEARNLATEEPFSLAFSVGAASADPATAQALDDLLDRADRAMYDHKRVQRGEYTIRVG